MIDELGINDDILAMFDTGWASADWSSIQGGQAPAVIYDGRDSGKPLDITLPHAKVFIEVIDSKQASLTTATGQTKYENIGLMTIQCFGALDRGDGLEMSKYMAIIAKRIYQGNVSSSGTWFRNCRANRIGATGGWFQFNTLIEFNFNELR